MEFREARSLAVLGKLESIGKTAEQVSLTPAAVHKQIKNLEREFGVPLYQKTGRTVQLTEAARVIMPYVEELLSQYDAITAALTEWKGLQRGFVRVGANPAVSSLLLPELLKQFREDSPGITTILDVDVSPGLLQRVSNRSLDLAIGLWDASAQQRVNVQVRWEYQIVPVVSPAAGRRYKRLKDLFRLPFIRLPQGSVLASWIDVYLRGHAFHPSEIMVVNNSHTIISLVRAGLGFGFLPRWAVASELESRALVAISVGETPLTGTLELITPVSGFLSPAVKAFIELARNHRSWEHLQLKRL